MSQSDALEPLRIIQVISRVDSQYDDGKLAWSGDINFMSSRYNCYLLTVLLILTASILEHEEFIDFTSSPDSGIQRVSCVSISTEEDLLYTPDRTFLVTFQTVESGDRFEGPNQISIEIVENGEK